MSSHRRAVEAFRKWSCCQKSRNSAEKNRKKAPKFIHSINSIERFSDSFSLKISAINKSNIHNTRHELHRLRTRNSVGDGKMMARIQKRERRGGCCVWSFNELDKKFIFALVCVQQQQQSVFLSLSFFRRLVDIFMFSSDFTTAQHCRRRVQAEDDRGSFALTLSTWASFRAVNMLKLECLLRYHPILLSNIKKSVPIFTTFLVLNSNFLMKSDCVLFHVRADRWQALPLSGLLLGDLRRWRILCELYFSRRHHQSSHNSNATLSRHNLHVYMSHSSQGSFWIAWWIDWIIRAWPPRFWWMSQASHSNPSLPAQQHNSL